MNKLDPAYFHKIYGAHKPRVTYYGRDLLDYALMILLTALVVVFSYGLGHAISVVSLLICAFMLAMFMVRHGIEVRVPLIMRRPQDVLYMFVYKLENLPPLYLIALGLLLLENVLIGATPNLPHHVELMRNVALTLFYVHFLSITGYRTAILVDHLAKKELAREILMQTPWKRVINEKTNITFEILHAYGTGVLTHIVLITPWYLVITHASFSVIFLPVVCLINVVVHLRWLKATNKWFYRDHWLGHNSELEFIFIHGTHHDAIPCGLIGVAGNGFLEGITRGTLAFPIPFYNPIIPFLVYTYEIKQDIDLHQYVPGIIPKMPKKTMEIGQHVVHHYGRLEPYSVGIKLNQPIVAEEYKRFFDVSATVRQLFPNELMNSIELDEELNGFQWDNPTFKNTLSLWDKYQK
jgi:hypothetical protein